jgi:hypothetical protein
VESSTQALAETSRRADFSATVDAERHATIAAALDELICAVADKGMVEEWKAREWCEVEGEEDTATKLARF